MLAERFEEVLCSGTRAEPALATGLALVVERMEKFVLLLRRQFGESGFALKHFRDSGLQFRQTFAIGFLIVDAKRGKSAVDKINHASFVRPGCVIAGDDTRRDGVNLLGFVRGEKCKFGRRCRFGGLVRVRGSSQKGRPMGGGPNRGDPRDASRQKMTAADGFIHFGSPLDNFSDCKLHGPERQAIRNMFSSQFDCH